MPVNSKFSSLFRNCTLWLMLGGCLWWVEPFSLFGQTPASTAPDLDEATKWLQSVHRVWNDLIAAKRRQVLSWETAPAPEEIREATPEVQSLEKKLDGLVKIGAEKGFQTGFGDGELAPEPPQRIIKSSQSEAPPRSQQGNIKPSKWTQSETLLRHNAVIQVTPEYPPIPKTSRLSGDVLAEVTIDPG